MSCVILLLMKDMAPPFVKLVCGNSTITDEALSFFLFYSTVQYVLYSYNLDAMDVGSLLTRLRQEIYTYSELVWLMKG